jgi:hypothetical protein
VKTLSSGIIFKGKWENGSFIKGEQRFPGGKVIKGDFQDGKLVNKLDKTIKRHKTTKHKEKDENSESKMTVADKVKLSLSKLEHNKVPKSGQSETAIDFSKIKEANDQINSSKALLNKQSKSSKTGDQMKFPDNSVYEGD